MLGIFRFFYFVCIMLLSNSAFAQVDQPVPELSPQVSGSIDEVGLDVLVPADPVEGDAYWVWEYSALGAGYLIVNFSPFQEEFRGSAVFEVIGSDGAVAETFEAASMDADAPSIFVPGDFVKLQLKLSDSPIDQSFSVVSVAYEKEAGAPFSIVLPDERQHVAELSEQSVISATKAVAQVVFWKGASSFTCTGFLVSENLLITNEHCVNTGQICKRAHAVFGRELDKNGRLQRGKSFRCLELLEVSFEADAALLRLDRMPGNQFGILSLSDDGPSRNDKALVIGHPAGQPKQVSQKGCAVGRSSVWGRRPAFDFEHSCDTLGGNSGSPVLSENLAVVGLHHFGFGDVPSATKWNKAVRIEKVIEELNLTDYIE